jgi:hypothetical protein
MSERGGNPCQRGTTDQLIKGVLKEGESYSPKIVKIDVSGTLKKVVGINTQKDIRPSTIPQKICLVEK